MTQLRVDYDKWLSWCELHKGHCRLGMGAGVSAAPTPVSAEASLQDPIP